MVRKSSGAVLFDSGLGGLTLADQFLQVELPLSSFKLISQIGARLPQNSSVYGFGEQEQHSFKLSMDWVSNMVLLEHYLQMFISVHSSHVCKGSSTRRGYQHVST